MKTASDNKRFAGTELRLTTDGGAERKKHLEKLAELKSAAIAELERRGYDVRGKTPAQIRQILKRRPKKPKENT
jgi:hypothetical protein